MKKYLILLIALVSAMAAEAKTLIVYYSYTNNVHTIATELQAQTGADLLRIEPVEKGLKYEANNYALGSRLISAIRNNPDDAASYPAIDPVEGVNLADYDVILIGAPLWWSNMAAPLQTYLFHNGPAMAGKKIGLIVSSASSGISGVEADAKRLIPEGDFVSPSLWIRSGQTGNCRTMLENWLNNIHYSDLSGLQTVKTDDAPGIRVADNELLINEEFDSVALFDLSGHRLLEATESPVSLAALTSGVYVAAVSRPGGTTSQKIIIH